MNAMKKIIPVAAAVSVASLGAADAPKPYGAIPSARQQKWHELEYYGFVHFTINTFTDKEWGFGDESPATFNPSAFDADQIVSSCATSGMKGLILTCKHHDGFCLWPSPLTEHSVKKSPWKGGKGDMVREFADACRRYGLKFGVYLSPWDRNHKDYGTPAYVEYYRSQLRDLLTNYGPIFEVWHDGANGGDGYYGGTRESRNIDRAAYYGWPTTWALTHELQPDACIFSDVGPEVRWVGNESGWAGNPCWATITLEPVDPNQKPCPGVSFRNLTSGTRGGAQWLPAEVDFSIRPGWFYHASQDNQVKSAPQLMDHYFKSVGHGASMLLNVPPDRRGLVHENDRASLAEFGRLLRETFATDLAKGAEATASNVRGNDMAFGPARLIDGSRDTYWASDDAVTTPEVTLAFKKPVTFNIVRLREHLPLGQRIDDWAVDVWRTDGQGEDGKSGSMEGWKNGTWEEIAKGTAIGSCRLVRIAPTTTTKVRLRITKAPVCPAIAEMGLFLEATPDPTLAGSASLAKEMGCSTKKWKTVETSYSSPDAPVHNLIDRNPQTIWHTHGAPGEPKMPQHIVVDMGETLTLKGFTCLPRQDGTRSGIVDKYAFHVSMDGRKWGTAVAMGEFANILNNPVLQTVTFAKPVKGRYFKFIALHAVPENNHAVMAELGAIAD